MIELIGCEAMEDLNNGDMDSLFEGMVLFTPQMVDNHEANSPPDVHSVRDGDTIALPSSQPLDENLFSDLTVIAPTHVEASEMQMPSEPTVAMTSSTMKTEREAAIAAPILRQTSRKKKRAGIRIGYGRDSQLMDHHEPFPNHRESLSAVESLSAANLTLRNDLDGLGEEKQGVFAYHASQNKEVGSFPTLDENGHGVGDSVDTVEPHSKQVNEDEALNLCEDRNITSAVAEADDLHTSQKQEKEEEEGNCGSADTKYEKIKAQISEKLKCAEEQASSISAAKKDSRRRRRKAAEDVELASVRYREIEKKLEEACEAEDFEMAERLSESLAAAEKEKEYLLNALRVAEAEWDAVDSRMQEVLEHQIATEEDCVSWLQCFSTDAVSNADSVVENAEVNISKEMDEWFMSVEAAETKKLELEIESQLVNEARSALNDSVGHLVEDDVREKEVLSERKKAMAQELEKLLSLVRAKEAEIAENDSKIEAVNKRIAEVASGFKDVQTRIDVNFDKLQSFLSQLESEREALQKKKEEIDNLLSMGKSRGEELRKLAMAAADEANMYQENLGLRKALVISVLRVREEKLSLAKKEETVLTDVQMLKQEISVARASLQELSSKKSSILQENAALKQRMLFIDKRLPELEAEKKVAASARNFKEAARIASEAKSLTAERENQQLKMEESVLVLGKLDEEINEITTKLQEFEELVFLKEKEAAMARFQRLRLVSAAASSERSAALELGDLEEANILHAEAEAADSEAKQLQLMHDISEDEFGSFSKQFIPMELVSSLDGRELEESIAGSD